MMFLIFYSIFISCLFLLIFLRIIELEQELNEIKNGIKKREITMIIDGNDMIDWGWTTIKDCNDKIRKIKNENS